MLSRSEQIIRSSFDEYDYERLQQCVVANTSYVLSASLPRSFFKDEYSDARRAKGDSLFRYRGNILLYYYRNINNHILETLRFYQVDEKDSFKQKVTSRVLFSDISYSEEGFDQLCREIADKVREIIPYSRFAEILYYTQINLAHPKAQLLSYLFSILNFAAFCREKLSCDSNTLYGLLIHSDYKKIAANFGKSQRILFEIVQLFRYVSHDDDLRKKHIFYEVGMNAEHRAAQYIQTCTRFMSSVQGNDFIRLKEYLRIMKRGSVDGVPVVGYMLSPMDSSLFAMNIERNHSRQQVQCILKAGEHSLFPLPGAV